MGEMARELVYLKEENYEIYSKDQIVRFDYCDNNPRIKKVYHNRNGYYIKGQPYLEPNLYLRNYEKRLAAFCKYKGE